MSAILQRSGLWSDVEQLRLTEHMRLRREGISEQEPSDIQTFTKCLAEVGAGKCNNTQGIVKRPPYIRLVSPDDDLAAL